MKNISLIIIGLLLGSTAFSFCGFYVAKADANLFNEASQVILARQGNRTVVTMSSDFQGDLKDFAMVVPVPQILKETDIKIVSSSIFAKLDAYSGPRLVEYHDQNPCSVPVIHNLRSKAMPSSIEMVMDSDVIEEEGNNLGVTIEAEYSVGEYDILILSAKESSGLEIWLTSNGYQIPDKARDVLEPYIKSDMKFFVVKVNLDEMASNQTTLNPLQISYESDNFMLPIRLGMANAKDDQEIIVFAMTDKGRVETTNYRTVQIPTNTNIPTFVRENFGDFYKDVFKRAWSKKKNGVYLEYAWDLSSTNFVKCDPCATTPPTFAELDEAGVFWVKQQGGWGANYNGNVFFTRLHVKYNRANFPQDLAFQTTPNKSSFQGRYVMQNPARGSFDCDAGQTYLKTLVKRMKTELDNLADLTGSRSKNYKSYYAKYEKMIKEPELKYIPNKRSGSLPIKKDKKIVKAQPKPTKVEEPKPSIKKSIPEQPTHNLATTQPKPEELNYVAVTDETLSATTNWSDKLRANGGIFLFIIIGFLAIMNGIKVFRSNET